MFFQSPDRLKPRAPSLPPPAAQGVQGQPQGHAAHPQGKCGTAGAAPGRPTHFTADQGKRRLLPSCRRAEPVCRPSFPPPQDLSSGQFIPDSDAISGAVHLTWVLQVGREILALQLHQACATRRACCLQAGPQSVGASCSKHVLPCCLPAALQTSWACQAPAIPRALMGTFV